MQLKERYRFDTKKDFIGKGGFSKVYRAYDTVRKRTVALKFYSGSASEKYDIISEINRMEDMVHENLIRYYDADILTSVNAIGETENIQVGIMEYANAGDIGSYFFEKRSMKITCNVIKGILEGLKYLHDNDIVHRDLKPKNILLSKSAKGVVTPKIADFGISKKISMDDSNMSSQLLGSVEYMAPEQFAPAVYGVNGKFDTNADLWSIGIIIYEIFSRKLPFGSRTKGITYEQILNNILFQELEVDYSLIPEPFKTIVRKCLVKHAEKRAKSAKELIDIIDGKAITVSTPSQDIKQQPATDANKNTASTFVEKTTKTTVLDKTPTSSDREQTRLINKKANQLFKEDKDTGGKDIVSSDEETGTPVPGNSRFITHEINVGKNLFKLGNFVESFKILDKYRFNVEFDTEAKFYLGYMYYNGKCGGAHDPAKGRRLMNSAKRENRALVLELMVKYVLQN